MHGLDGMPILLEQAQIDDGYYMCTNLHGPSLMALFKFCNKRFSVNTTVVIGLSILDQLEKLHSTGFIHNDIKPDNIVIGLDKDV